ncbi:O-methyltransferase [Saccharopolyspora griseoalba]|uniref:O-methyltransferase n=1 Tax=Saccharopolyspora griseoalba TaxID=1431848 RepID=A0ABW2LNJ4_9PSEU
MSVSDEPRSGEQERARPAGSPVGESTLHVLRFLAASLRAKAAVEVGTGTGDGALSILGGMVDGGVLTSIDADPAKQRVARRTLREAGHQPGAARLITGRAPEVLPRLTDGGYDLVSMGPAGVDAPMYLELGKRLLRPGGVIVFDGVPPNPPESPGALAASLRELVRLMRDDEELVAVSLPTGPGLLVAAKR